MSEFTNLATLYAHVEKSPLTDDKHYEVVNFFQNFRDAKQEANDSEAAEKAQWEIHFLSFYFVEGECRPEVESYKSGQVLVYPTLEMFDDKIYAYLQTRLDVTQHPKLKARYAQILWCSRKTKHRDYAEIAIDSYLEYITSYEQNHDIDDRFSDEISEVLKNAYSIALRIKHKTEHIKSEIKQFIQKFSSSAAFSARNLISYMLETKRGFNQEDFAGLENICWQIAESFPNDADIAISFLRLGKQVDQRLEKQSHNWILRIAQHNEAQMTLFENAPEVALVFCMKAIQDYKQVGDSVKQKALEERYTEFKKSTKYHTIKTEFDIKDFLITTQDYAREFIRKATSEDIIRVLFSDKILFPTKSEVESSTRESIKISPTTHLLPKVITDRNNNVVQHFGTPDELMSHSHFENYKLQLETSNIHLINAILLEAVREKKLTIRILLSCLNKLCWYGKLPNWVQLIAPALNEYFEQIDFYLAYPEHNVPNFVLCLDSLTLKIEGLFRDLCHLSGVNTTYHRQDHAGRNIAREKDIEVLLREEAIQKLFDEDDLLFFKFLLVEKCGYNLRHDIAHSLLPSDMYNINYMNLMILALLRLGKYDFRQENAPEDEAERDE